jgi:hypothetical protein
MFAFIRHFFLRALRVLRETPAEPHHAICSDLHPFALVCTKLKNYEHRTKFFICRSRKQRRFTPKRQRRAFAENNP